MEVNKIYNEDCLETLKKLPDNSVDLVIADPPYEIVSGGGGGCFGVEQRDYHKGVKSLSDGFENVILDECKRVLKVFNCYFFCSKDQVLQILLWAKENSMNTDILCYHKLNPIPTTNNKYLSDTEYILFMRGAGAFLGGIIIGLAGVIFSTSYFETLPNIVLSIFAVPFGILICWGFYKILAIVWSRVPNTNNSNNDSLDSNIL